MMRIEEYQIVDVGIVVLAGEKQNKQQQQLRRKDMFANINQIGIDQWKNKNNLIVTNLEYHNRVLYMGMHYFIEYFS